MFSRVEPFVQFGRRHHEESFCEIILNMDQWLRRYRLKDFKSSSGGDVVKYIPYLELWQSVCPFEPNHLCKFGRGNHGEQFCEII